MFVAKSLMMRSSGNHLGDGVTKPHHTAPMMTHDGSSTLVGVPKTKRRTTETKNDNGRLKPTPIDLRSTIHTVSFFCGGSERRPLCKSQQSNALRWRRMLIMPVKFESFQKRDTVSARVDWPKLCHKNCEYVMFTREIFS